ncbi:MAG TPA: hypothetical protein VN903_10635 [Polyangia bacterium]|nr:hypothetical protein [Polyangia bacterium]
MARKLKTKSRVAKTKRARVVKVDVKKVELPVTMPLQVMVPKDVVPIITVDKGVVDIVPMPRPVRRRRTWWQLLLGD